MDAISHIKDGATIMMGGFGIVGEPHKLIDGILEAGIKDLTIITTDTAWEDKGSGRLVTERRCKKVIASHIGTNKQSGIQMNAGELEVELIPQGTLIECIRASAYGLGGILTPTGIGTAVEEGKQKINVDGKDFLIEKPLRADFALIFGAKVDRSGNITYKGVGMNSNHVMAGAANMTIVEAGELVDIGDIHPNHVNTPGIFIDYVVGGGK